MCGRSRYFLPDSRESQELNVGLQKNHWEFGGCIRLLTSAETSHVMQAGAEVERNKEQAEAADRSVA